LQEFGFGVKCGKSTFAKKCETYVKEAFEQHFISASVYEQMTLDCQEIQHLLAREKGLDKDIIRLNKDSHAAQLLITIPGVGPLNASMLSNKPMALYEKAKDFSASLGLVPKQNTTGGTVRLGSITKQGDRYGRTILIQAARSLVMQNSKSPVPGDKLHQFIARLKQKGKHFNVICVAVANKLSRIAYACLTQNKVYNPL
jgi:transposase